jgi:hypothetical protein
VKLIYLEVEFIELYQGQPLFAEVRKFMNQQGFKLYGFDNFKEVDADAFFINESKVDAATKLRLNLSEAVSLPYNQVKLKVNPVLQATIDVVRKPWRDLKRRFLARPSA